MATTSGRRSAQNAEAGIEPAPSPPTRNPSLCRKGNQQSGFTLVEMMVALAIFALVASAGVGLLAFGVRAQAAAGDRLDDAAALRRVDALLAADLAQALPRPTRDEAGAVRPAFAADDDGAGLTIVRGGWSNPDGKPRASVQKVRWSLEDGALVRRAWPMLDGAAPGAPATLLRGVGRFALRYRLAAGEWRDRWDATSALKLPRLVEATITLGDAAPVRATYLVGAGG